MNAGLGGLYRVMLVMHGGRWASQIVNLINLHIEGECDVMPHQLKRGTDEQMRHIGLAASEKIIDAQHIFTTRNESIAKMRAKEAGTTGD
jgi:hypothetical protein